MGESGCGLPIVWSWTPGPGLRRLTKESHQKPLRRMHTASNRSVATVLHSPLQGSDINIAERGEAKHSHKTLWDIVFVKSWWDNMAHLVCAARARLGPCCH